MSTVHLRCLDALASASTGKPVQVWATDLDGGTLGEATYAPKHKCYRLWLDRSLLPGGWRQKQLSYVFWHEIGHLRAGHCNPDSKHWHPDGLPTKVNPHDQRRRSVLGIALLSQREQEADEAGGALRNGWPYRAYDVWKLLQGKESYP